MRLLYLLILLALSGPAQAQSYCDPSNVGAFMRCTDMDRWRNEMRDHADRQRRQLDDIEEEFSRPRRPRRPRITLDD